MTGHMQKQEQNQNKGMLRNINKGKCSANTSSIHRAGNRTTTREGELDNDSDVLWVN